MDDKQMKGQLALILQYYLGTVHDNLRHPRRSFKFEASYLGLVKALISGTNKL